MFDPQNHPQPILKYPLNLEMIDGRLSEVEEVYQKLVELKNMSKEKFLKEKSTEQYAARAALHIALQALLDVSAHLATRLSGRGPQSEPYRENLKKLAQNGAISSEFLETAEKMAGYRNRLIHFYLEVEPLELYEILQNRLADILEFKRQLARFADVHRNDKEFLMQE